VPQVGAITASAIHGQVRAHSAAVVLPRSYVCEDPGWDGRRAQRPQSLECRAPQKPEFDTRAHQSRLRRDQSASPRLSEFALWLWSDLSAGAGPLPCRCDHRQGGH
jgi:hypothetical protein